MRGISLGLYPDGSADTSRFEPMIDEIAALGATHLPVVVTWGQDDVASTDIAPGDESIGDDVVRGAISRARERGLEPIVFPILTVRDAAQGQWRGTIRPSDVDTWWEAYERFILHYAQLADDEGAAGLVIGSELGTTEAWKDRWYHLISRVEKRFGGDLIYSANWDHYEQVSFWRRVDYIGVTGYFELTTDDDASTKQLTAAWKPIRRKLVKFADEHEKPLWITEVGYTSTDGAATHPWDYTSGSDIDVEEQRRCYAAFVDAWDGEVSLAGVFFWNWYGDGGNKDRGYTPKGKPAEKVLRSWFAAD